MYSANFLQLDVRAVAGELRLETLEKQEACNVDAA